SRRRHTRFSRDWSSDVCSSDLVAECSKPAAVLYLVFFFIIGFSSWQAPVCIPGLAFLWKYLYNRILLNSSIQLVHFFVGNGNTRSEERRVGKACRCGRSTVSRK